MKKYLDLAAVEGTAEIRFHGDAVGAQRPHRRLENLDAVAAGLLGVAHRDLGVLQHVFAARVHGRIEQGEADRGGQRDFPLREGDGRRQRAPHDIGERDRLLCIRLRHDDGGKLVAVEPGNRVLRLQQAAEAARQGQQDRVAGGQAYGLIDLLEAVDVDADDGRLQPGVALGEGEGRFEPVEEQLLVRQAGQIVVHGIVQQALLGNLALGDVAERADDADDLAVGADDRTGLHREPEVMAVRRAEAEILVDAAAALLQHGVEASLVAVALERMQHLEPGRGRPFERPAAEAELLLDLGTDVDAVGDHVPIEDDVAAAGQGECLATGIADGACAHAATGKGILHDRESDQHDDEDEAADQRRRHQIVGQGAGDGERGADHPGQQQEPRRDQHHGAVVTVRREVEDQDEADAGDGGERDPGDTGGDRRVVDGEGDERDEEDQPCCGDARGADMPAAEVEIGEQKDQQSGGEHHLRTGAPDPVALPLSAEDFAPKPEVDADVRKHRPGQRRGGREDYRALDDEDDGQEQRQQAGDADDDALVECEAGDLVLVGFRLPQIELRQIGRAQLGDIGDGRAGIERQPEHVGIAAVVTLWGKALACGDRGNAGGAKIGPNDPRANEPEMRSDDQALDLFVGVVGKREDDPVRPRSGILGAHLDAADDTVGAWRRRDEQAVALRGVAFDRLGQVDRRRVERDARGFDRARRRQGTEQDHKRKKQAEETQGQAHGTLKARRRRFR